MIWLIIYVLNGKEKRCEVEADSEHEAMDNFRSDYGFDARIKRMTPQVSR